MPLPCVNKGGETSRIRLPRVPRLEREILLDPLAAEALSNWQVRSGAIVTVSDPEGGYWRGRVTGTGDSPRIRVFQAFSASPESPLDLWVLQALPARERFELVLQKLTELGVGKIVPFVSRRSLTLAERDEKQRKSHRWPEVVRRAALQCRRATLPELHAVASWEEMMALAARAESGLLLNEGETALALEQALPETASGPLALVIGPEGGFDPGEIEAAAVAGLLSVTLGGRVVRTETAAMIAAALVQHRLGDLGRRVAIEREGER